MAGFRLFFGALAASLLAGGALAETRALLIGVSDYDEAAGFADLRGPVNDMRLMADVLTQRGADEITILADGIEGAGRPTYAAIKAAFQRLAEVSEDGDFVYIHLSGHGTQQRDTNGDETDGADEVFLPIDIAPAEAGVGLIRNGLVDDEIGAAVSAIRAKGADVWLVMDSCHSGSGLRAGSADVAARFVDPAVLGVDLSGLAGTEAVAVEVPETAVDGGLVAFYAARASESATELNLGAATGEEAWYGLFTSKLAARLQSGAAMSFRQLFQAVLSDMNDDTVPGAARRQTPLWDGSLIDAAVFGGADTVGLRRFAVRGTQIQAGLIHGLGEGTLVGLVADAADPADAVIGYAQMEVVSPQDAFLRPVAADCAPRADQPCETVGSVPQAARFAQVVARPVDLAIGVAPPRDLASGALLPGDAPPHVALAEAIDALNAAGAEQMRWDPSGFDVETVWDGARLWFGPRATLGDTPTGAAWAPGEDLVPLLRRIARAEEYARIFTAVAAEGSPMLPSPVRVEGRLFPAQIEDLGDVGSGAHFDTECPRAVRRAQQGPEARLTPGETLKQCDKLSFVAKGLVSGAVDVNRVYIDAQYCVRADYETIEGKAAAQRLGVDFTICTECDAAQGRGEAVPSAGVERMFVVMTEAQPNAEAQNLEGLLETCGPANVPTRGGAAVAARDMLASLARNPGLRGARNSAGTAEIWVEVFDWQVLPRAEVFARAGR